MQNVPLWMILKCWPNKYLDLGRHHNCLAFYKHTSYDWKLSSPKSKRSCFLKDFNLGRQVLLIVYVPNQPRYALFTKWILICMCLGQGASNFTHKHTPHTHILWVLWTWEFSCELPFNHRLTTQGYGGGRGGWGEDLRWIDNLIGIDAWTPHG